MVLIPICIYFFSKFFNFETKGKKKNVFLKIGNTFESLEANNNTNRSLLLVKFLFDSWKFHKVSYF